VSLFPQPARLGHIQKGVEGAVLGSGEGAEIGRGDMIVNVARIQVVGEVINAKGSAESVVLHPGEETGCESPRSV
jgi:hypothetical protein